MSSSRLPTRLLWLTEGLLFVSAVAVAAWTSRAQDWDPMLLAGLLLALALVGERLMVFVRGQQLSASFVALVLAMSLLGPAPAVLIGVAAKSLRSATGRLSPALWLNNLSTYAVFPLVGALGVYALIGNVHAASNHELTQGATFGLVDLRRVHGHEYRQLRDRSRWMSASSKDRSLSDQVRDTY
jgi:hypothetical protein